jgi:O-methyltransferase involved in polyketide biosynthesis
MFNIEGLVYYLPPEAFKASLTNLPSHHHTRVVTFSHMTCYL